MDPGWLKTSREYLTGEGPECGDVSAQGCFENVTLILDTVVAALRADRTRERTFMISEMAFFEPWWWGQDAETRAAVRDLVAREQIEFAGGGWVMPDEATTRFEDSVAAVARGHAFLAREFGVRPRVGWQADCFGHSSSTPGLLHDMGVQALFMARLTKADYKRRKEQRSLEFTWRGRSWRDPRTHARLFTHSLIKDTYCHGIRGGEEGPEDFLTKWKDRAQYFRTRHLLLTWGCDFAFGDAAGMFEQMDEIIAAARANPSLNIIRVRYSTLWEYAVAAGGVEEGGVGGGGGGRLGGQGSNADREDDEAEDEADDEDIDWEADEREGGEEEENMGRGDEKGNEDETGNGSSAAAVPMSWPVKRGGFFPYCPDALGCWTGYYTSRPLYKRGVRVASSMVLRPAQQIAAALALVSAVEEVEDGEELVDGNGGGGSGSFAPDQRRHANKERSQRIQRVQSDLQLDIARLDEAVALAQHHDAITGTSRVRVMADYMRELHSAVNKSVGSLGRAVAALLALSGVGGGDLFTPSSNVAAVPFSLRGEPEPTRTIPRDTLKANNSLLVVVNTLGWARQDTIFLNIPPNSGGRGGRGMQWELFDETQRRVPSEVLVRGPTHRLVARVVVPPLGFRLLIARRFATVSSADEARKSGAEDNGSMGVGVGVGVGGSRVEDSGKKTTKKTTQTRKRSEVEKVEEVEKKTKVQEAELLTTEEQTIFAVDTVDGVDVHRLVTPLLVVTLDKQTGSLVAVYNRRLRREVQVRPTHWVYPAASGTGAYAMSEDTGNPELLEHSGSIVPKSATAPSGTAAARILRSLPPEEAKKEAKKETVETVVNQGETMETRERPVEGGRAMVQEVYSTFGGGVTDTRTDGGIEVQQILRVYSDQEFVEIEMRVGVIPSRDENHSAGAEVAMRYEVSGLTFAHEGGLAAAETGADANTDADADAASVGGKNVKNDDSDTNDNKSGNIRTGVVSRTSFSTDMNSLHTEHHGRRAGRTLDRSLVPITSHASLKGRSTFRGGGESGMSPGGGGVLGFSVLVNHAQAASSMEDGVVELIVNRWSAKDDEKGMGEPVTENQLAHVIHRLVVDEGDALSDTRARQSTLLAHPLAAWQIVALKAGRKKKGAGKEVEREAKMGKEKGNDGVREKGADTRETAEAKTGMAGTAFAAAMISDATLHPRFPLSMISADLPPSMHLVSMSAMGRGDHIIQLDPEYGGGGEGEVLLQVRLQNLAEPTSRVQREKVAVKPSGGGGGGVSAGGPPIPPTTGPYSDTVEVDLAKIFTSGLASVSLVRVRELSLSANAFQVGGLDWRAGGGVESPTVNFPPRSVRTYLLWFRKPKKSLPL
jgi:hypothetical protein